MTEGTVAIEVARVVDDELAEAFARVLPQLSPGSGTERAALEAVVAAEATTLFVARLDGRIVGMLTLVIFPLPSGVRAWIEDVVVDEDARGSGVGQALVELALRHSEATGAKTVDLTSRPSREAANRLYERVGFRRRETNVYRIELRGPERSKVL